MTVVKICGVTRPEDVAAAVAAGADLSASSSSTGPRCATSTRCGARRARGASRPGVRAGRRLRRRGSRRAVDELADELGLDRVQLHGVGAAERSSSASARGPIKARRLPRHRSALSARTVRATTATSTASRATPRRCTRTGGSRSRLGASDRVLLAGRARPGQRRRRRCASARPWASTCARGIEIGARRQGPRARAALRRRGQGGAHEHHDAHRLDVQHPPDALGRFGRFGGRFVPETVMAALDELEAARRGGPRRPGVRTPSCARLARDYVGRADAALPRRAADRSTSAAPASS